MQGADIAATVLQTTVQLGFNDTDDELSGVLYYLGTAAGTQEYSNPHSSGQVVAAASSGASGNQVPEQFVQRPIRVDNAPSSSWSNHTKDTVDSWMSLDLGHNRELLLTHYSMQHGSFKAHMYACIDWELQGSQDGQHWTLVKQHNNDTSLLAGATLAPSKGSSANASARVAWQVQPAQHFRYFRILQTGPNASAMFGQVAGSNRLCISAIELYGELRIHPNQH